MEISHKTQAALQFLVPSAILYTLFGAYLLNGGWPTLSVIEEKSASFAFMGIAAMLVQDLIPKSIKECLVFWRFHERMPGYRAFSSKSLSNPQIDAKHIPNIADLSNASADIQQREFYKLYKSVADVRAVAHFSQRYIAWRDLSALLVILGIVSIPVLLTFDTNRALPVGLILSGAAFVSYLMTSFAARNVANGLVIQVLSIIGQGGKENG